jgi:tetratricopeptide (TPR) repeat protein
VKKTGDEYFDSNEFRDLLAEYEKAVNTGQPVFMDADELAEIADFYQMTNRLDEAESTISLALSLSPGAIAPLTYRIHEALYQGDTQ